MGRPPKDGRYVNFLMDVGIFEQLVKVAEIEGRTKTAILENALKQYISAYRNENGEINAVEATYTDKKKPCKLLDTVKIGEKMYCKIYFDGDVLTVPIRDVVSNNVKGN